MAGKTAVSKSSKPSPENSKSTNDGERATLEFPGHPFAREMKIFAGLINTIKRRYEDLDANIRREELQKVLREMFEMIEAGEIKETFEVSLAQHLAAQEEPETPPETQTPPPSPEPAEEKKADQVLFNTAVMERSKRVLYLFLNGFLKISHPEWKFRNKFLEQRLKQAGAKHIISSMNANELQDYLLSENLLEEEADARLNLIDKEVNETVRQHQALVEVYRENLEKGFQEILRTIDLTRLEEEISREALVLGSLIIPYRYVIPFYVRFKLNRRLKQIIYSMLIEDLKKLTEKYFGLYL